MSPVSITPDDLLAFRAEVRAFLQHAVPDDMAEATRAHVVPNKAQAMRWQSILAQRGWAAPNWPLEAGGTGWSLAQQAIFKEEVSRLAAPLVENLGIDIIGPTLIRLGTPAQKQRFLPAIISGENYWAQAYSEPNAGSDLAALRTTARWDNGEWVINGSKIWQSHGTWADWALVLVRSDPQASRRQEGLSILLVALDSPGVTVRPIQYIHGGVLHVEIFFDEVRVPADQCLGEPHKGWGAAKDLLVVERIFTARAPEARGELARMAVATRHDGSAVLASEPLRAEHLRLSARLQALDALWWPSLQSIQEGSRPMLVASVCKLEGTLLFQDIQQLWVDAHGLDALFQARDGLQGGIDAQPASPDHAENLGPHFWRYRGITLGGGTAEVQRGIIAQALFKGDTDVENDEIHQFNPRNSSEVQDLITSLQGQLLGLCAADDATRDAAVGQIGLAGMCVSPERGGAGLDLAAAAQVTQVLGEHLVRESSVWPSVITEALLQSPAWSDGVRLSLEARAFDQLIAWAHHEGHQVSAPCAPQTTWRSEGGQGRLSGRKTMVFGDAHAAWFWVSAVDEQGDWVLVEVSAQHPDLIVDRRMLQDGRHMSRLHFDGLLLGASACLARGAAARELVAQAQACAALLISMDSIGAMRRALQLTLEHLRTRQQFGRPLADFQVLQHRMADHYRQWAIAKALALQLAHEWPQYEEGQCVQRSSALKWYVNRLSRQVALDALQMHGAMGLQNESRIAHVAKRLVDNQALFGDVAHHEAVMAEAWAEAGAPP